MGEAEQITEYTIAVDVFGKPKDFRETKDSIVRVEVHRLRKRLLHFYQEEGASHRVRIVIPTGKYAPEFVSCEGETNQLSVDTIVDATDPSKRAQWPQTPVRFSARATVYMGAGVVAVALAVLLFFSGRRVEEPLKTFWQPVLSSSNQILLCVGTLAGGQRPQPAATRDIENPALTLRDFHGNDKHTVHIGDAETLARFAGLLQANGKSYRVISQSEATFADLQRSPAILIGLLNNYWTEQLVGRLRFTIERPGPGKILILDRNHPARCDWLTDFSTPVLSLTKDYALVLRVFDPKTEQMVVAAAGISAFGTLAAGEFLTTSNEFRKLEAFAPKDWKRKNLEIVLSTEIIKGRSGHPKVEAVQFW